MRPRAFKFCQRAAVFAWLGLAPAWALAGADPSPSVAAETPAATPSPTRKPKAFPFPLPINESTNKLKIPEMGLMGQLLSQMSAEKATRLDEDHLQMHELKIDLNKADGKQDFHILLPTSIFNLKTRIITSDQPVTVKTDDFELTGERMEFNTLDHTGKLLGHVSMHIHNLKQVATVPDGVATPAATPAP